VRRVLEDLLEAQELQDGEVHGRMEAKASLIGSDGTVELDAVATVDAARGSSSSDPGHAEHDGALRLDQALEQTETLILGVRVDNRFQRLQDLGDRLMNSGWFGSFSFTVSMTRSA
jgi:hypothetical protein